MRIKGFLLLFLFLFQFSANGQVTFQKALGIAYDFAEWGYSVKQTTDGGFIVLSLSNEAGISCQLTKVDNIGDTLWMRKYGGPSVDFAQSVEQTFDQGYIVCGITQSFGSGYHDIYLFKVDNVGALLWSKAFGGTFGEDGISVKQTADSGYVLTGHTMDTSMAGEIVLIKTNPTGNIIWQKRYGGIDQDFAYDLQLTNDGGYVIAGSTQSWGSGMINTYILRTDSNGDTLWTKVYSIPGWGMSATSILENEDSSFIVLNHAHDSIVLMKLMPDGDTIWTKGFTNTGNFIYGNILETLDNGYIFSGTDQLPFLIKTNSYGDTLWTREYGIINGAGYAVDCTSDSGFIITGEAVLGSMSYGIYLIKTDKHGNSGCYENFKSLQIFQMPIEIEFTGTIASNPNFAELSPPSQVSSRAFPITTYCSSVNIKEAGLLNSFVIFPNPASSYFKIDNAMGYEVALLNTMGVLIWKSKLRSNDETFNCENLPSGIYFIQIQTESGSFTQKLIKQ